MQHEYGNRMDRQGPPIDHYATQQQYLSRQTAGGMEFRDCQNPDASDGYIVGPNEKVSLTPLCAKDGERLRRFLGEAAAWPVRALHARAHLPFVSCEQVPGFAPDYIKQQPHRELTDEECAR